MIAGASSQSGLLTRSSSPLPPSSFLLTQLIFCFSFIRSSTPPIFPLLAPSQSLPPSSCKHTVPSPLMFPSALRLFHLPLFIPFSLSFPSPSFFFPPPPRPSCCLFSPLSPSRSLPAMQTLKVNLHSKVSLLGSATVTGQFFYCCPSLFFSALSDLTTRTTYRPGAADFAVQ